MNVIKRLRRKFIFLSTVTVVIIVVGVLGLVNTIVYMRANAQVESFLSYISQNDGNITPKKISKDDSWFGNTDWSKDTPDFPYQIRFFSVLIAADDHVEKINLKSIAAFTEQEALQYAQNARDTQRDKGRLKKDRATYAYMISRTEVGDTLIVIVDCTREMALVNDFTRDSITLGFICILLYVCILAVLSKRVIKPFVRNMENQKRFITNAGHELKTPIAIISANMEAMELINGRNQWTESILKQAQRLTKLINDLIILAKMSESSPAEIIFTRVSFSEIANEVLKSFGPLAAEQNKCIVAHIGKKIFVKSESKYLYELVNILVDNAVKYCDEGGEIEIKLTAGKRSKEAVLTVANDYAEGKNIDYARFFERFYRGDISHSSEKAGYGIGLSIAKELIVLLKGKISVEYTKGKIVFTVKITTS